MRVSVRAIVIKDNQLLVMHRNKFGKQFYALVGGSVDIGETNEAALHREVGEETSLIISNPRLVIEEHAGEIFGMQYIYLCDYVSGEPKLAPDSEEAQITAMGLNLYEPMWLPLSELSSIELLPKELHQLLMEYIPKGFPEEPLKLTIQA